MLESIWHFVNDFQWYAVVFGVSVSILILTDIRRWYRERVGKDITLTPQLTLFTDDGDKIHVLSVNEEQGRYVLYHSRSKGLQLATERQFMKLKGGSDARSCFDNNREQKDGRNGRPSPHPNASNARDTCFRSG